MEIKEFNQLPRQSSPFTHLLILTAADLTETTAATAQEFRVTLPANCRVTDVVLDVRRGPEDLDDATLDDVQITIGDSAGATQFMTAKQIAAKNGTPIKFAAAAASAQKVYTAADYLKVVITPETGKNLAALDVGEIRIYVTLHKRGQLG